MIASEFKTTVDDDVLAVVNGRLAGLGVRLTHDGLLHDLDNSSRAPWLDIERALGCDVCESRVESVDWLCQVHEPLAKRSERRCQNYIYFIKLQSPRGDAVKIGITRTPAKRLAQLKTANPWVEVIGLMPGGDDDEKAAHDRWGHLRIAREWFLLSDDLSSWILKTLSERGYLKGDADDDEFMARFRPIIPRLALASLHSAHEQWSDAELIDELELPLQAHNFFSAIGVCTVQQARAISYRECDSKGGFRRRFWLALQSRLS